jgi:AraC family transcriptional regulator of adaptative response / DNA-3-methyladenine glycosylase II
LPASVDAAGFGGRDRVPATDALGAGALTHVFPDAATIAGLHPATLPMPLARARSLITLASALASGDVSLDPGADRDEVGARLLTLPGIGPWTAGYIRMRALSDPDVFLAGDVGVARALRQLTADGPSANRSGANGSSANGSGANGSGARRAGANGGPLTGSLAAAERWRPWRSYATHHLWAVLESAPARTSGTRDDAIAAKLLTTWLTVAKNLK